MKKIKSLLKKEQLKVLIEKHRDSPFTTLIPINKETHDSFAKKDSLIKVDEYVTCTVRRTCQDDVNFYVEVDTMEVVK